MTALRVLYDISGLGLGQISAHGRGGSYRADRHLTGLLSASRECELLFCANHSSLAYQGAVEYLRAHAGIGHVPLLRHGESSIARALRGTMVAAHRWLKIVRGGRALPPLVRESGRLLDARVHRPVVDATPPIDIHHSATLPLPPRPRRGRSPVRFVTIYDLRATRFPDGESELSYQKAVIDSVDARDWVITSSESTRRELCELRVADPHRIVAAPLAADRETFHSCASDDVGAIRRRYGIPRGSYILMLRDVRPRKNIVRAVQAFADLVQQERAADQCRGLAGGDAQRSDPIGGAFQTLPTPVSDNAPVPG